MKMEKLKQPGIILVLATLATTSPVYCAEETDFSGYLAPRQSPLVSIKPHSYLDVLERLDLIRQRFNNGEDIEVPRITINMESGKAFTGYLLGVSPRGGEGRTVIMEVSDQGQRFGKSMVSFINIDEIDAVIVHRAEDDEIRQALSLDDSWQPRKTTAPTRLDIQRNQAKFGKFLTTKLGKAISYQADLKAIPQDNKALQSLATAMSEMTGAIADLSKDPDIKAKLASVKRVRFIQESAPSLEINDGVLTEGLNLSEGDDGRPNRKEIRALIVKVLGIHNEDKDSSQN